MRIRLMRVIPVLVLALCSMFAVSSANSGGNGNNKVYVCHVLPHGKFNTQYLPQDTAEKLVEKHPDQWILGKCEDVVSPS